MANAAQEVTILHFSDTHGKHWEIKDASWPVSSADLFIHTGDFSNTTSELKSFAEWLRHIGSRFTEMLIITGNHDWNPILHHVEDGRLDPAEAVAPGFFHQLLQSYGIPPHCRVIDHELVEFQGLRIFGSGWCPWHSHSKTDGASKKPPAQAMLTAWGEKPESIDRFHRFDEIPMHVDVLLTHGPSWNIMDCCEGHKGSHWGSSRALTRHIYRAAPRVHLFGHLHEQRGFWKRRDEKGYEGGIEYRPRPNAPPYPTNAAPPPDYPCELIVCNAMANHAGIEGTDRTFIAGRPALLKLTPHRHASPEAQVAAEAAPETTEQQPRHQE